MTEHTKDLQGRRQRDDKMLAAVASLQVEIKNLCDTHIAFKESIDTINKRLSKHSTKINWMIGVGSGITATVGFIKAYMGFTQK